MGLKKLAAVIGAVASMSFANSFAQDTNYLSNVERTISSYGPYERLKGAGMIEGILYNPSPEELACLASNIFSKAQQRNASVLGTNSLESCVQKSVKEMAKYDPKCVTLFPIMISETYGKGVPRYILILKDFASGPENKNPEDLKRVIWHETNHVLDLYLGRMGRVKDVKGHFENVELVNSLFEIRADFPVLKKIFEEEMSGKRTNSDNFMGHLMAHYSDNWKKVDRLYNSANEFEKAVIKEELERCSDIIMVKDAQGETYLTLKPKPTSGKQ